MTAADELAPVARPRRGPAHAAALAADAAGLCVLPPKENGTKRPDAASWTQYQGRRSTASEIADWYANGRTGLGLVCGAVSGGLEMLEFEGRAVADGIHDQFRELCEAAGLGKVLSSVLAGYSERTPSGGYHLLYRVPVALGNTPLAKRPATAEELIAKPDDKDRILIETRGEGGYVIVAPSNGKVHPDGGEWRLVAGGFDTIATLTDEERDELWSIARVLDQMPAPAERPVRRPTDDTGDRPGDAYARLPGIQERTVDLLVRHGWTWVYRKGEIDYLRRPGKGIGVSATVGYAGPGVLHNFSSSVAEFEVGRSYGPFSVYGILEHGGDFSAAARALAPPVTLGGITPTGTAPPADQRPARIVELDPVTSAAWPAALEPAAFLGLAGDIVAAVAEHTEADPVAVLGSLLTIFGALAGRHRWIHQGSRQGASLYVVLVGDSAISRKGTSYSVARTPFDAAYPQWKDVVVAGLGSGEGLIGHLKRLRESGAEAQALVQETELGRLLTVMSREGSTLSSTLREAWDGVVIGRFISREGMTVAEHHVGLLGHVTTRELRERLTGLDAANGFGNRFLWLAVRRSQLVPFPESLGVQVGPFVRPLRAAIEAAHEPRELTWTPAARERWTDLYNARAEEVRPGLNGALTARAEAQITRLALTYAMLDRAEAIDVQHLAAGEALASYAERSVTYIFGDSTGDPLADFIRSYLGDGPATRDELRDATGMRDAPRLTRAIDLLVELRLARIGKGESTGRRGGRRPVVVELAQLAQFPPGGPAQREREFSAPPTGGNCGNSHSRAERDEVVVSHPPPAETAETAETPVDELSRRFFESRDGGVA